MPARDLVALLVGAFDCDGDRDGAGVRVAARVPDCVGDTATHAPHATPGNPGAPGVDGATV